MPVVLPYKLLTAFNTCIEVDQGANYRGFLGQVIPHIGDAYRTDEDGFRGHMGASVLGGDCGRAIWYSFHWATKSSFDGRILRLFNRGHLEEARFIALLLAAGMQVYQQDAEGKQFRISFADGHGGGSGDGVVMGVPDLPESTAALCEFKTHGNESFEKLAGPVKTWREHVGEPLNKPFKGEGVRASKFEHFVQMQLYMHKMGLAVALYVAVNKNTDDIYAELVMYDREIAETFIERAEKLVNMPTPPKRINESPGFYKCRFCDHKPVCHLKQAPHVSCRTCTHAITHDDGNWYCKNHNAILNKEAQQKACHLYEPFENT